MKADNIKRAYDILKTYNGSNAKICRSKIAVEKYQRELSPFDVDYILQNYDYEPKSVNSIVGITPEFGQKLRDEHDLDFTPTKVLITSIVGELNKCYHCYVQFRKSVPATLMFVNKNVLLTDINAVVNKSLVHVDFEKYDSITRESGRLLKDPQKEGIEFMLRHKKCILADTMGFGKAQPVNTLIPTPYNGLLPMGDLKIGSKVFDSKGEECKVVGVYPQGKKKVYRVKFNCGSETYCCKEHLWIVKDGGSTKVVSLDYIMSDGVKKNGQYQYEIPLANAVNFVGIVDTEDPFECGKRVYKEGFSGNAYWLNTSERRVEYLRGLLSGGIHLVSNRKVYFKSDDESTMKHLSFVVRSLGGVTKSANLEGVGSCLEILMDKIPMVANRSAKYSITNQRFIEYHRGGECLFDGSEYARYITEIEECGEEECVCIKVDSEDSSYLTNDFIVTHNTTQATVAAMESGAEKVLIICPASLKSTWKRELMVYNKEDDISIVSGSKWDVGQKFTIINYDILMNFYEVPKVVEYESYYDDFTGAVLKRPKMVKNSAGNLVEKKKRSNNKELLMQCLKNSPMYLEKFDCVIIDEAHKLSNNKSIRYDVISHFLETAKPNYVFLLSGTPLTNKPINLYHVLKLIDADVTKDYYFYINRYCGAKKMKLSSGKSITLTNGATNVRELQERINHVYIRRLLTELSSMVEKTVLTNYYDLSEKQEAEYNKIWDTYVQEQLALGNDNPEDYRVLVESTLVRQYLAKEMTKHTKELVDEKLEEGEKVIIVCTYKEEMEIFKEYYKDKCVLYNGSMTTKQKDKSEHEFMNNPKKTVFIGQIVAASVGLTLTASRTLIFNSYSYNQAENLQMEDRIYRLVQTRDVVCIYQLFTDSISQRMYNIVMGKGRLMKDIVKSEIEKKGK